MSEKLIDAITQMREDEALQLTHELLDGGTPALEVLDACRQAMDIIGQRFESGESFIPELMMAGEILTAMMEVLKPRMVGETSQQKLGKVVLGTAHGDIHDIGKDIVGFMLDIHGFEVVDLGVDVPPARFVDAVQETGARVVGLSGFLTLTFDPMRETVAALRAAGCEVKVMIGGGQIDELVREYTGADAYGRDAVAAVNLAKKWTEV